MVYVFDSGPFIDLFRHYYPDQFPSLWNQFGSMIDSGAITSTRDVMNELVRHNDELSKWCNKHKGVFVTPSDEELNVVRDIFNVRHFQAIIRIQQRLKDKPVADPFVIARAKCLTGGCVVTTEKHKDNAAKIPNVCEHFQVDCTDLEGFMRREGWKF